MPSAYALSLTAERDAVLDLLREFTAAFVAAGSPGDFQVSIEGESYDFTGWRAAKLAEIDTLNEMIRRATPTLIRSRQRG